MAKEHSLIIGAILFLLFFVGSITYLLTFHNNVNEILGTKCARTSRINVDYPFCTTVLDCVEDCATVKGGFVKAETVGGFGNPDRCFCLTQRGIENIW